MERGDYLLDVMAVPAAGRGDPVLSHCSLESVHASSPPPLPPGQAWLRPQAHTVKSVVRDEDLEDHGQL